MVRPHEPTEPTRPPFWTSILSPNAYSHGHMVRRPCQPMMAMLENAAAGWSRHEQGRRRQEVQAVTPLPVPSYQPLFLSPGRLNSSFIRTPVQTFPTPE